ncbi:hypothetical protein BDP81DRAFT_157244 [Colletotrichum phormii]|uniref:Uncharacterized protein n=1 Tax=Colletotrichum phormii TaxID=359342 RepID=A0AAJ0EKM2_9PEZI|nr:uncharacterized protein BDP81DRAFT_157244 [Colletotrichum phormii]KAK1640030.1 hypothetical protein BDP81DRAFT_157244 [Colletotrichum phormii]
MSKSMPSRPNHHTLSLLTPGQCRRKTCQNSPEQTVVKSNPGPPSILLFAARVRDLSRPEQSARTPPPNNPLPLSRVPPCHPLQSFYPQAARPLPTPLRDFSDLTVGNRQGSLI